METLRLLSMKLPLEYYAYSGLFNTIAFSAMAVIVLLKQPRTKVARLLSMFMILVALWMWFYFLWLHTTDDPQRAEFLVRTLMIPVALMPPVFLHFASALTGWRGRPLLHVSSYLLSFVISATVYDRSLLVAGVRPHLVFPYWPIPGIIFPIHLLHMLLGIGYAFWLIYRAAKQSTGYVHNQLVWVFWGFLTAWLSGCMNYPSWYQIPVPPIFDPFVSMMVGSAAYAIIRHQFLDIRVVIRKSLIYSLLVTILTISYFGSISLIERLCQNTFGYRSVGVSLAAFALMAIVSHPLKLGVQRFVDRLFFHAPREELIRRMERLEHEVREPDKLRAVSVLAAGMAHEIKNPLTAIKTFTEFLPEKGNDPDFQQTFHRIVSKEVNKLDQVVRQLLEFARPAPPQPQPIKICSLLDETLDSLNSDCVKRRITVQRTYGPDDLIHADPNQLRQVFLNLLLNSLEAMDGHGGTLSIQTTTQGGADCRRQSMRACLPARQGLPQIISGHQPRHPRSSASHMVVIIQDTGCGIAKEHLERLFEPFFTTKSHGTGLGLSIVKSIIEEHGGEIAVDSTLGLGTRFTLTFPVIGQETVDSKSISREGRTVVAGKPSANGA